MTNRSVHLSKRVQHPVGEQCVRGSVRESSVNLPFEPVGSDSILNVEPELVTCASKRKSSESSHGVGYRNRFAIQSTQAREDRISSAHEEF